MDPREVAQVMRQGGTAAAFVVLALLAVVAHGEPPAQDARPAMPDAATLLARAYANLYSGDFVQQVRIESRIASGRGFTRRVWLVRKQSAQPGKVLLRFTDPEDIRGTSMLLIERSERHDDVFVYLPALRKVRRVATAQRGDSFFGTDLSYEDLEPRRAEDFEPRLLGPSQHASLPCWEVEVRPRKAGWSYERTVSCIEVERALILWTEFYRDGKLLKRLEVDPVQVRPLDGGRWLPFYARLRSERGSETELSVESHDTAIAIPDALFTTVNLESGSEASDRQKLARPR